MAIPTGYHDNVASQSQKGSRINSDVERVLSLARHVTDARNKVLRHTSALGYFSDAPETCNEAGNVKPIANNMQNALGDLERAIDGLNGALSLFD